MLERVSSAQEGSQQGGPVGGLLFCLAIHPILRSITSPLTLDLWTTLHWKVLVRCVGGYSIILRGRNQNRFTP